MLWIYGDESHDSSKQRVFVVAGLLGDAGQWASLKESWTERTGGTTFHAADCESGYGDYRNAAADDRGRLHLDLTRILANSGTIGWGLGIDLAGCRRAFPDMLPAQIYCSGFLRTLDFLLNKAHSRTPPQPVEIVFDRHPETKHNFGLLFQYASEEGEWKKQGSLPANVKFATRAEIGIQAADLWAREMMKFLDGNLFSKDYVPRPQWTTLMSTRRFGGDLQLTEYFDDMKRKMPALEAQTGMSSAEYVVWLQKKRRHDNQSNRIAYMMDVAAKDRSASRV
jgi:hypothetical protein